MKTKYWIAILAGILVISIGASVLLFLPSESSSLAQISTDGVIDRVVSLRTDQQFTVPCPGGYNTVTVRDGKIAVTEATCPDQYCIRQGFCSGGRAIVCLPNRLVITFLADQEIDGQIG